MSLINATIPGALDELLGELDALGQQGAHIKLLLDGALHAKMLRHVAQSGWAWLSVFTQSQQGGSRALLSASPLVLHCPADERQRLVKLLLECEGLPMASFWVGQETLPSRTERFLPWCIVKADDLTVNLRYPDTRRLPEIVRILDVEQRGALFGDDTLCLYQARDGSWQRLAREAAPQPVAEAVKLDARQTLALLRDAEADEILHALTYKSAFPPASAWLRHQSVQRALQALDQQGIQAAPERQAACEQALKLLKA